MSNFIEFVKSKKSFDDLQRFGRSALCTSKKSALIDESVAVMRYPTSNK